MKKNIIAILLILGMTLTGCSNNSAKATDTNEQTKNEFNKNMEINVITREDGSGTRGAFIELFEIEEKNDDGTKTDRTTKEADVANKTDIVLSSILENPYAIGYISLGSLNDSVKAVQIDGVEASSENVKNGSYMAFRPFNIVVKDDQNELAQDFINYIMSAEGQQVVAENYIPVNEAADKYQGEQPSGKIVVSGSSSVTPVMEKLKEAYELINDNANIEIQMSDSTSGIANVIDKTADIGMASRDLKDSESEQLDNIPIALDGIAVIVNLDSEANDLSSEQVKQIFTGEATKWSEILE